jgi:elongation factor P
VKRGRKLDACVYIGGGGKALLYAARQISRFQVASVIASNVRKGNVIEKDGKLYVVLTAENIHPGKGTPVTQLEMRRISDGVKINERYRTTDTLEKAFIDERTHTYLYRDGDQFVFMDPETYDQVHVPKSVIDDAEPYLIENMEVRLSSHNGVPISIEIPARATFEVVETEPAMKGQTASGSFKPAMLSNGVRTMVPTHITTGTRVVVLTADGSYVERAKD